MNKKKAIIIGAGPAGLTAAYELLDTTDIKPVIYEETNYTGGISKTINFKGNRIDIGGHRFFSKSERVMDWWLNILPPQGKPAIDDRLLGRKLKTSLNYPHREIGSTEIKQGISPDPENDDEVMLNRNRLSRIFFLAKFFDYPVTLNYNTLKNLGIFRTTKIGLSYLKSSITPISNELTLEDFFINRFGTELYQTFFKDYTEKVWGTPCNEIDAEWGYQRIKGLSIKEAIKNAIKTNLANEKSLNQNNVETSLISKFYYPKLGPGQMWEKVADLIIKNGGEIIYNTRVTGIKSCANKITGIEVRDVKTGKIEEKTGDYFLSTMPVKDLISSFEGSVPKEVTETAEGLIYRDFITVGLLLNQLKINNHSNKPTLNNIVPDNWIYIQERNVKLGRLQIFNNWSPYMIDDPKNIWIGLEYFCNEGDELWEMEDEEFIEFAVKELSNINVIEPADILDSTLIREKKTYPAYFGTYKDFDRIKNFTDKFENLFLIGRNGMHRYNNMDHSMLTAMEAVNNIINKITSKDNLWSINAEKLYHES